MEITHLGHSEFKISGKNINIITDPFDPNAVGIPGIKTEADVVTVSHNHFDHNYLAGVRGEYICFDTPGEYEIKGADISGIPTFHDDKNGAERGTNTVFVYDVDGIKICHLGDIGHELSSEQLEKIDGIDILLMPVGGKFTIGSKAAAKILSEISPKIVIPMHYKVGKMNDLEPLENFLKEIGTEPQKAERLKILKKDLPENLQVYVLK